MQMPNYGTGTPGGTQVMANYQSQGGSVQMMNPYQSQGGIQQPQLAPAVVQLQQMHQAAVAAQQQQAAQGQQAEETAKAKKALESAVYQITILKAQLQRAYAGFEKAIQPLKSQLQKQGEQMEAQDAELDTRAQEIARLMLLVDVLKSR